jgi:hypothetical protein
LVACPSVPARAGWWFCGFGWHCASTKNLIGWQLATGNQRFTGSFPCIDWHIGLAHWHIGRQAGHAVTQQRSNTQEHTPLLNPSDPSGKQAAGWKTRQTVKQHENAWLPEVRPGCAACRVDVLVVAGGCITQLRDGCSGRALLEPRCCLNAAPTKSCKWLYISACLPAARPVAEPAC